MITINRNSKYNRAEEVFKSYNGFARAGQLTESGLSYSNIKDLQEEGSIEKVKRGLYKWHKLELENDEGLIEVSKAIPKGVICLLSSLSFYGLTTHNPWEYYIAIPHSAKKPSLDYPPVRVFYYTNRYYNGGVDEVDLDGHLVNIYNMEKTLCDCIRYRNRIGIDIVKESFRSYMARPDKDLNKLVNYSVKFRVKTFVKRYLEVL